MKIFYSPQFEREYQKLPDLLKRKAQAREKIFRANPFDARLKTHRLGGRLAGLWAFSIDYRYRIIFDFKGDSFFIFHAIGDHSLYRRL